MKKITGFVILFFLCACTGNIPDSLPGENLGAPEQTEKSTGPKKAVSSSAFFVPPLCSGNNCCAQYSSCAKQCDQLFRTEENKKLCLIRPASFVDDVYNTVHHLTNPRPDTLSKLKPDIMLSTLQFSEKTWLNKIHQYSKRQARSALLWLSSTPEISLLVLSRLLSWEAGSLLSALLRKNASADSLVDDNKILSGLKKPVEEKNTFLQNALKSKNNTLIKIVHQEVVVDRLCEYSINRPWPIYMSDNSSSACVLAVYCYITGSYKEGLYQDLPEEQQTLRQKERKKLVDVFDDKKVTQFIQDPVTQGGLGIPQDSVALMEKATEWPDSACQKLGLLWEDGGLKFGL